MPHHQTALACVADRSGNVVTGPSNSWTIHGLWPDNCDGTYDSSCDSSRAYTNMTELIQTYGSQSLLDFMNTYWLSDSESAEAFWEHEWSKHGTCVSTLEPSCLSNYQTGEEAVTFFQVTVDLFKSLDTYTVSTEYYSHEETNEFVLKPIMLTLTLRFCPKPASSRPTAPPTPPAKSQRPSPHLSDRTR